MKNLVWVCDKHAHGLIAGGTGGGKTYIILNLIEDILHNNAVLYILDTRNADIADLGTVLEKVQHSKVEMSANVTDLDDYMLQRIDDVKQQTNNYTGYNAPSLI
ncbi:hypothetical protein BGU89_00335 [Clostridioides difficile]|uniref:DEAD/DEAH box helicase family protein n=1 Tax=Clostridioides difficile TaxID=1496 RepID=UPI000BB1E24A|nr:DEAD/DEAH box helicase family protein [Clostridioides difficile]PBG39920.1 hypothetical protein BGU89_00335 [Clostridioides difficile]